jgi:hypothetical protein
MRQPLAPSFDYVCEHRGDLRKQYPLNDDLAAGKQRRCVADTTPGTVINFPGGQDFFFSSTVRVGCTP